MSKRSIRTFPSWDDWQHLCVVVIVVWATSFFLVAEASAADRVAIISIDQDSTTLRTIRGVRKAIDAAGVAVTYQEAILSGNQAEDQKTILSLTDFDPKLFVTIGSYATSAIAHAFPNRPIIFATVINPEASGFVASMGNPGGKITGASLDIPPDIQFKYLQRVVTSAKTVGVLYSPETKNVIAQALSAAQKIGVNLIALQVQSEKEIPQAIDSLCKVSDALWSIADQRVYTPQSTRYIILQTLRNRIPMMGFSQALVEAGGLFTLDFDFKDIGRQAGEIALRVLGGASPGAIPTTTPGIIYFKYNEKTADRIRIKLPDDLLAIAKEVVK